MKNILFSKFLVEFSCEAVWTWAFVCWKIFDYSFNFRACDGSVEKYSNIQLTCEQHGLQQAHFMWTP